MERSDRNGDDRRIATREAVWTSTALELPPSLSYDQWAAVGERLKFVADGVRWWVGDWVRHGERAYGEMYSQALDLTGLDYQSLRNCAWVAGRFPPHRRREKLSWSHHQEVSSTRFSDETADQLLDLAEAKGWSRDAFRRIVHVPTLPEPEDVPMGRCPTCRQAVPLHVLDGSHPESEEC